ncbi:FAD-binding oxidoreductase [Kitasatospora terrestris]|uniref:FAD-binding oxidoreductase n=1 Tax=Kitasatospora terrestris TaxID=258051 RepID=A0ABP9EDW6_9ACTN
MTRIVVVGAGSIGSCVALRLARRGADVVLVDAREPAEGLSAHGFGWVNAVDNGSDPYYRLSAESLRAHERLAAETADGAPWFFRHGNLHWADSAEGARRLAAVADGYRAKGYPVEEVDAERARRDLQPGLALDRLHGPLVHYPADAHVVADRFVAAVQEHGRRAGVRLRIGSAVTGLLGGQPGGRVRGVELASGERIEADAVVSCAGRGTRALLGRAGADVPLVEPGDGSGVTVVGLLVRTTPLPVRVDRVLHAPHLSIRPHSGGRVVLHCHDVDEELTHARQGPAAAERVLARLAEVLPGTAGAGVAVEDAYVGVRPMPVDGMSVVGPVPGVESLYVVVTHSGLTLAPVLGEIVAQELLDGPSPLAAAFRPERFAAV